MKKISVWEKVVNYINGIDVGCEFTRTDFLLNVNGIVVINTCRTCDYYRSWLTKAGFLESVSPGKYKKKFDIPKTLTSSILTEYVSQRTWQSWFIPFHEKLGVNENEVPKIKY